MSHVPRMKEKLVGNFGSRNYFRPPSPVERHMYIYVTSQTHTRVTSHAGMGYVHYVAVITKVRHRCNMTHCIIHTPAIRATSYMTSHTCDASQYTGAI